MDPVTGLVLALLFSDLLTGGWVHSALIGGATGAGREAWRDLAPRIPPSVAKSRTVRAAAATGRGLWYGGGAVVRGTRTGFVPGVVAGHERWRGRRHWWHRAADLGTRFRLWVRGRQERPVEGSAPTSAGPGPDHPSPPGGGPGGGRGSTGTPGSRSPTTGTGGANRRPERTTTPRPHPATGPVAEPQPVATTGGATTATTATDTTTGGTTGERPPLTLITGGATTATDPTSTTTDTTDTTDQEDTTVSATTVDVTTPNTATEDVPAHIQAGEDASRAISDVAEQFTTGLEDMVRQHIAAAESIPGFPPSLQGQWEDNVAGPLAMVTALLQQAAEGAQAAAKAEADALRQSVEAADAAPADSDLSQSVLRTR